MINNVFNIYDENGLYTNTEKSSFQYNMQTFDNLIDSMLEKKNSNILYRNTEIEIK